ncbi:hypothetical protein HDC92_000737 [Pedobacter sp. AK017]|nr:hypothetical protein [Pedobacter sp. AK017]
MFIGEKQSVESLSFYFKLKCGVVRISITPKSLYNNYVFTGLNRAIEIKISLAKHIG